MCRLINRSAHSGSAALFVSAALFILSTVPVQADEYTDWCWQNSRTTQNELWGVSVVDSNIVWIAGYNRTVLKTVDGGNSWSVQDVPTSYNLQDLSAVNAQTAWAVGGGYLDQQVVLKTSDGGKTWTAQTNPAGTLMLSVSAVDAATAWAVGANGKIIKTVNGGQTWSEQTSPTGQHLWSVTAVDQNTAWAVGWGDTIIKTTNGATWAAQNSSTAGAYFFAVTAVNGTHAWAVADGGIIATTTNGTSWRNQVITSAPSFRGVSAADETHAWAVGSYGKLYATLDGENWAPQTPPGSVSLNGACVLDTQTVWAVGNYGTIIRTDDGGATWLRRSSAMDVGVNNTELKMTDATNGWVVGFENGTVWGRIYRTADAGYSWTRQDAPGTITHLYALTALDTNTAWATGYKGYTWRTTDGHTWTQLITPPLDSGSMRGISAANGNTAWQVGDGGLIWKTENGSTFTVQSSPTSYHLTAVHALSPATAYAVGASGTILKTTDGTHWNLQTGITPATSLHFSGVYAVNAATAWAVGEGGMLYKTTDGANWIQQTSPTALWLNKVWASDGNHAWAVADQGSTLIRTTNGTDWAAIPSPVPVGIKLAGVTGVGPDCVWAVGSFGTIIHTCFVSSTLPIHGPQGRLVTITGSGFGPTRDASFVSFGGIPASPFGSWSDSRITCFVPAGVPMGLTSLWVEAPWGKTRRVPYTIDALAMPHIDSLAPASGPAGREVRISGTGFGLITDFSHPWVTFGSVAATAYTSWNETEIRALVPSSILGTVQVNVHTAAGTSNALLFDILRADGMLILLTGRGDKTDGKHGGELWPGL
jgi:photosystem II stability/assembly factor-like uncharacterized protein